MRTLFSTFLGLFFLFSLPTSAKDSSLLRSTPLFQSNVEIVGKEDAEGFFLDSENDPEKSKKFLSQMKKNTHYLAAEVILEHLEKHVGLKRHLKIIRSLSKAKHIEVIVQFSTTSRKKIENPELVLFLELIEAKVKPPERVFLLDLGPGEEIADTIEAIIHSRANNLSLRLHYLRFLLKKPNATQEEKNEKSRLLDSILDQSEVTREERKKFNLLTDEELEEERKKEEKPALS